jgi:hypothetical protein
VTQPKETKRAKSDTVNSIEEKYRILFYEIIDKLVSHLSAICNLSAHFPSNKKVALKLNKLSDI